VSNNQKYKRGYLYFGVICALLGCFVAWLLITGLLSGEVLVIDRLGGPNLMVSRVESPVSYWFAIIMHSVLSSILLIYGPAWSIHEYLKKPKIRDVDEKETIPAYCSRCKREGLIEPGVPESSYLVKCSICNSDFSYVWCKKCEIGGDLFENVKGHETSWRCPECKEVHKLPNNFYENSIYIKFNRMPNKGN